MLKILQRIATIFLLPCFIADPGAVRAYAAIESTGFAPSPTVFTQALSPVLANWMVPSTRLTGEPSVATEILVHGAVLIKQSTYERYAWLLKFGYVGRRLIDVVVAPFDEAGDIVNMVWQEVEGNAESVARRMLEFRQEHRRVNKAVDDRRFQALNKMIIAGARIARKDFEVDWSTRLAVWMEIVRLHVIHNWRDPRAVLTKDRLARGNSRLVLIVIHPRDWRADVQSIQDQLSIADRDVLVVNQDEGDDTGIPDAKRLKALLSESAHVSVFLTGQTWGNCHLRAFQAVVSAFSKLQNADHSRQLDVYFPRQTLGLSASQIRIDPYVRNIIDQAWSEYLGVLHRSALSSQVFVDGHSVLSKGTGDPILRVFLQDDVMPQKTLSMVTHQDLMAILGPDPFFQLSVFQTLIAGTEAVEYIWQEANSPGRRRAIKIVKLISKVGLVGWKSLSEDQRKILSLAASGMGIKTIATYFEAEWTYSMLVNKIQKAIRVLQKIPRPHSASVTMDCLRYEATAA